MSFVGEWWNFAACRDSGDPDAFFAEDADGNLAWTDLALCAETDPEVFYPEKGCSTRPAKLICSRCLVREQCLEYALEHEERFGIWGGLSERERRRLRNERRAA